jgi:hypothetical protein
MPPGLRAIWQAVSQLAPAVGAVEFLGFTGGAFRTPVPGHADCPMMLREVLRGVARGLPRLGIRMEVLPLGSEHIEEAFAQISPALRRGRPVPVVSASGETVITRSEELSGSALPSSEGAVALLLTRERSTLGLRSHRELLTLADALADLLRPPALLEAADTVTWGGLGLCAYDRREEFPSPSSVEWAEARAAAGAFLADLAGRQRTRYANRLRTAGILFGEEAALLRGARLADVCWDARRLAREAALLLGEAVLPALGLGPGVCQALLEDAGEELDAIAFREVQYLARAGAAPLRILAARRLAGAHVPESEATLFQLLFDSDFAVREAALWSLLQVSGPEAAHHLHRAAGSDDAEAAALATRALRLLDGGEAG